MIHTLLIILAAVWQMGDQARVELETAKQPHVVIVLLAGTPHNEQLEQHLLAKPVMREYLQQVQKVKIVNGENFRTGSTPEDRFFLRLEKEGVLKSWPAVLVYDSTGRYRQVQHQEQSRGEYRFRNARDVAKELSAAVPPPKKPTLAEATQSFCEGMGELTAAAKTNFDTVKGDKLDNGGGSEQWVSTVLLPNAPPGVVEHLFGEWSVQYRYPETNARSADKELKRMTKALFKGCKAFHAGEAEALVVENGDRSYVRLQIRAPKAQDTAVPMETPIVDEWD